MKQGERETEDRKLWEVSEGSCSASPAVALRGADGGGDFPRASSNL